MARAISRGIRMRCKDCNLPQKYENDEYETQIPCALFGYDNYDEHFKVYANGDEGCIHRKSTIEKLWKKQEEYMANDLSHL